jgi:hypothetical protein
MLLAVANAAIKGHTSSLLPTAVDTTIKHYIELRETHGRSLQSFAHGT